MTARPPTSRTRALAGLTAVLALAAGSLAAPAAIAAPAAPTTTPVVLTADDAVAPQPDVVDVQFDGTKATDAAKGAPAIVYGTPTFSSDPRLGQTMTVNGTSSAVAFDIASSWDSLTDGFTIDCVFKVTAALPTASERDLCSDKEAGGVSLWVNGQDVGFMGYIGGGYKNVRVPIESDRWYHVAAAWDGARIKLFVNGQLAGQLAATGALQLPDSRARRWVVGADASPTGIGQHAPAGTVFAGSGVYSEALTETQVRAVAAQWDTTIPVPQADVLEVDFSDGTPRESVADLEVRKFGAADVVTDGALHRPVGSFPAGGSAFGYAFDPQWSKLAGGASIQCTFRWAGKTWPTTEENAVCSGKEAGGLSIYINGDQVGLMAHIGGGYKTARSVIEPNRWYDVVATWDGAEMRLYVDGELTATTPATGALGLPNATARAWTLGGDSSPNQGAQFYAPSRIAASRIWSRALTADEVRDLKIAAFGDHPSAGVEVRSTVPGDDATLSEPVELSADIANEGNATGWTYKVDDVPVQPGDLVGPGLAAGPHVLVITATDVFGKDVRHEVRFTTDAIPEGAGTDTQQGGGTVTLAAVATSPDGSDVTTTFREARPVVASGGFQGVMSRIPSTLDFEHTQHEELSGEQSPDDDLVSQSPSSGDLPFQRFDVQVGDFRSGQQVLWKGTVDPARSVSLLAWHSGLSRWTPLAESRGVLDADTALNGTLRAGHVDGGIAHLMVVGTDPFADDLSPRDASAAQDKDRFEDPSTYDFAFAHFTDTQYLAEGAAGGTYDDWDGVAETKDVMKEAERVLWAKAYEDISRWIGGNAAQRKIAYAGHTGDIIENDYYDPLATDGTGKLLYPGLDEQVTREFEFTSGAHRILDESGVVNHVIAGNHDNQLGNETGPSSRFNRYFSPDRYYDLAGTWPAGSSYHTWDETADAEGAVTTRGQDNQNNYVLFSAGGLDFVAVGLSYGVTEEEAQWASDVFARYPDRNGILTTHAYIKPSSAADGRGADFSADGSRLYRMVVDANPNVFLVLAGHEHGVGTNLKTGIGATVQHDVVELLADYQFYKVPAGELWPDKVDASGNIDLDGDGVPDHKTGDLLQFGASWLRLLQFDVDRAEVSIDTYSPHFDNFGATEYDDRKRYNGAEDNLRLPVDLTSRTTTFTTDGMTVVTPTDTIIGEDTARSGWPATVTWSGLDNDRTYAWVAQSRVVGRTGVLSQFGSVFTTTFAGTDKTAPTLVVPATTELTVGDSFDPMDGVSAVDNADGDITGSVTVSGAVDTGTAGAYPLVYVVSDANGNQTVANRTVRVAEPVDDRAATSVSASNVPATFGQPVTLGATVTPATATGSVRFLNGEEVLCEAPVANGRAECLVGTLPPPGSYVLTAAYGGDPAHVESQKTVVLTVAQPQGGPVVAEPTAPELRDPRLRAGVVRATLGEARVALRARLVPGATGRVTFTVRGTGAATKKVVCRTRVRSGTARCKVRLKPGRYRVVAAYSGSSSLEADKVAFTFRKRR